MEKENEELKKKVETLKLALDVFKGNTNLDSSNSSKPSSTNGFKRVIQNSRVKSGKKPGREKGYVATPLKFIEKPNKIVEVETSTTCDCGGCVSFEREIRRQSIGIKIVTNVTEYMGQIRKCECGKIFYPKFPKNINNPIQYEYTLKTLLVYLNTYCNIADRVISEFLSFVSDDKLNIAPATIFNTVKEFSSKSKITLEDIKKELLKSKIINNDETPININEKKGSALGVFTNKLSLIEAHGNRKFEEFVSMGILNIYQGISCHHHNNMHFKFANSIHSECNAHPTREAKGIYEVHKFESINKFLEVLYNAKEQKEKAIEKGEKSLSEERITKIKDEYLKSLTQWDEEYIEKVKGKNPKYFNKLKCLKNRLREFVDDHLRFLTDFDVPFTNNLAEIGLRPLKTKSKIIGCFRTLDGAKDYCNAKSIIDTCKKQKENIGKTIEKIMNNNPKVFEFQM